MKGVPQTLEEGMARYRPMVEGYDQAEPTLVLSNGEQIAVIDLSRDALGQMADLIRDGMMAPGIWAMYSSETWSKTWAAESDVEYLHRGVLEERHNAGDQTIGEGIVVLAWSSSGEVFSGVQSFMRTSTGVIWGEVIDTTGQDTVGSLAPDLAAIVGDLDHAN